VLAARRELHVQDRPAGLEGLHHLAAQGIDHLHPAIVGEGVVDPDLAGARLAVGAKQRVVAGTAEQDVVTFLAEQKVIVGATVGEIVAGAGDDPVAATAALQGVVAGIGRLADPSLAEEVLVEVAGGLRDHLPGDAPVATHEVALGVTEQDVVTAAADQLVAAATGSEDIVASTVHGEVAAFVAVEPVALLAAAGLAVVPVEGVPTADPADVCDGGRSRPP